MQNNIIQTACGQLNLFSSVFVHVSVRPDSACRL